MSRDQLPGRPFRGRDAHLLGLPSVESRAVARVLRGVYVATHIHVDIKVRAEALLLVAPADAAVARHTAAALWGGVVPYVADLHLVIPDNRRMTRSGVMVHRSRDMTRVTAVGGVRLTDPIRTFLELGDLGLVDLVVLGDSLVRRTLVTPAALVEAARDYRGPRAALVRRAAALVRSDVDSPMETRLRVLVVLAGLPEPRVNVLLRDASGRVAYRLDLGFERWKVALEYDGRHHAVDGAQWRGDISRRADLDDWGWRSVVVISDGIFTEPERTLERVASALRHAGAAGVRMRSTEWRRHFPGRRAA